MAYETLVYNRAAIGSIYDNGRFTPSADVTSTNWLIRNDTQDDMNIGDIVNVYDDNNGNLIYSNATYMGYFQFGSAQRPFIKLNNGDYALFGRPGFGSYNITGADFTQGSVVACFCADTRIRTTRGEVAVEALRIGDHVVTASGAMRPIRWIGHRTMACHGRRDVMPVRIAAHAFGEGRPARDLLVSPAHAICVDLLGEVLIPACRLVNGSTITQVEMDAVTYWHVELDSHDILLAEGLPAESYLDMGNRGFFAEADIVDLTLGPDATASRTTADFCRPFHEAGPLVDLVRTRLRERAEAAGWTLVQDPWADLHLVADGTVIRPDVDGLTVRFVLPVAARDVRLVSHVSAPAHVTAGATDLRRLGVSLCSFTIDDGLTGARIIALDDARLGDGFHPVERNPAGALWRWTDGSVLLPSTLWAGCRGTVFLALTLAQAALPRWVGPHARAGVIEIAAFRQRA